MRYQRAELPRKLDGLAAARAFFAERFGEGDRERLWVAHVDEEARCLHLSHHEGDAGGVAFPMRSIILDAAVHGSVGILLAHNHPSGDVRPSKSDLWATRRLATAAEAIDCQVLDHLVFAGTDCASFRSLGYL